MTIYTVPPNADLQKAYMWIGYEVIVVFVKNKTVRNLQYGT